MRQLANICVYVRVCGVTVSDRQSVCDSICVAVSVRLSVSDSMYCDILCSNACMREYVVWHLVSDCLYVA